MSKKFSQLLIVTGGAALLVSIFYLLISSFSAVAFTGPGGLSPGSGVGALGIDSSNNVSVGSSTTKADTKFLIVASSTDSNGFGMKIINKNGDFIFSARNDGRVSIATSSHSGGTLAVQGTIYSSGNFIGNVAATQVTAGVFASGNFTVQSSLGVATTTNVSLPQSLSVYGGGYFTSKVGIGTGAPVSSLDTVDTGATQPRGVTVEQYSTDTQAAIVALRKARGTLGSPTVIVNGDVIANILSYGYDGSNFVTSSQIHFTTDGTIAAGSVPNAIRFLTGSSTIAERMRIDSNGNVGIGLTPSGTYKLEVSGSVGATAFYYTSDESLKMNIRTIDGLGTILGLRGVRFNWKNGGAEDIGLIAQEVEGVAPELVATNPDTGLKSVKYGNLVAPLIESVKELNAKIETQGKEIDELKAEVQGLKSLVGSGQSQ